jgi:streptogrisin D
VRAGATAAQAAPAGAVPGAGARVYVNATARWLAGRDHIGEAAAAARIEAQVRQSTAADGLTARLGAVAAGTFFDADGRLVVNVTTTAGAATVVGAGMTARLVPYSTARLDGISRALRAQKVAVGTYWSIDTAADRLVLTIPNSSPAATTAALLSVAGRYGAAVRVARSTRTVDTFVSPLAGGYPIGNAPSGARCSAGFNVRAGGALYLLDAGHCVALGGVWVNFNGDLIGPGVGAAFPVVDTGLIAITSGLIQPIPAVFLYQANTYQPITVAANAVPGQGACKTGSTSLVTCGVVVAKNACVAYPQGVVCGLDQTNIVAQPGDSGGSYFAGAAGLGTVSGGNAAVTFFQPLTPALAAFGVALI